MVTYKEAGVNIDAGNEAVELLKEHVKSTYNKNVLKAVGSFGSLYEFPKGYKAPVLVSSTDGVGTKLKLAYKTGIHHTVGQDLLNHCVNDILVQGAVPLYFLDYIGTGKLNPKTISEIVRGFSIACRENSCALVGGETAELPNLYKGEEYDLAGFIVGVVEKDKIIDGSKIKEGDIIIGISSNGLQTNGYSLALKAVEMKKYDIEKNIPELGSTIRESLMKIHPSYLKPVMNVLKEFQINGMAHITGGGLVENIPRVLPEALSAHIKKGSWQILPIFKLLKEWGNVPEDEMYRVFNMGIGMVLIVDKNNANNILNILKKSNTAQIIGEIKQGNQDVVLE